MSDDVIRIKTRVKYQGAWMPWRELANDYSIVNALREKAPDGYGLGSNAKLLTADDDLNTVLTTGWYNWSWDAHPQNAPDNNWREYGCAMHVFSTTPGGYAIQTVYDLSDDITHGCAIQRTIYVISSGNIYYPWEWVNPPMQIGVEYRTTERYLGKPVYKKLDANGIISWRPENESDWRAEAGYANVEPAEGFSLQYPCRVFSSEHLIHVTGEINRKTASFTAGKYTHIGTLPVGYRPSVATYSVGHVESGGVIKTHGMLSIDSNGQIFFRPDESFTSSPSYDEIHMNFTLFKS